MNDFIGSNLRLIRLFHNKTLSELGDEVHVSKQFLSRLESGAESVSKTLIDSLAESLDVLPEFFYTSDNNPITEEQCHFRRQLTTKLSLRQVARAKGEMLKKFVGILDEHIDLPAYKVIESDPSTHQLIEDAAERFRGLFDLGISPIKNITRVAENAGTIVFKIDGLAPEIDAISFATKRPLIALNKDDRSACRERFGIAHELGHFAMHIGVLTGDKLTETQANRFASALLMPKKAFSQEYRLAIRGSRLNWQGLKELKLKWGVSKAAILYRGHQLGYFNDEQYRSGYIGLNRKGQAYEEEEDVLISREQPEILNDGLDILKNHYNISLTAISLKMSVQPRLLIKLLNKQPQGQSEVVNIFTKSPI